MYQPIKTLLAAVFSIGVIMPAAAQTNDTPAEVYQWKKGKTEFHSGYVVLKSGKRMDGKISLLGSASSISEVAYEGDDKKLTFPAASLKSYGLTDIKAAAEVKAAAIAETAINESPESMYEWRNMGVVMDKVITSTLPRAGYVVLKNGTRLEGELKLRRKDGVLTDIDIKTVSGKEKFDVPEVARYGYTVSEAEVTQSTLDRKYKDRYPGAIVTASGKVAGEISLVPIEGKRYSEKVVFKGADGKFVEHTPKSISGFSYMNKSEEYAFAAVEGVFLAERYNGKTFQVYRNPNPTSINEFATSVAKTAMQVGTTAAATAVVSEDQKKNNYKSNMDSIIMVSSKDQLVELRDKLVAVSGYSSAQEVMDKSDNESLKANLGALQIAIAGRQAAAAPGGILNDEWIILNKTSGEKTIVWKSKYKDQIDVLLMGCDKYIELSKPAMNDLQKWDNQVQAMKLLDGCY
jgi:hypothetical protein